MEHVKHLLDKSLEQFNDSVVPKIPVFAGNDMTSEVYYFKPGQVLQAHRHPNGEQIFFFLEGEGTMKVGDDDEFRVDKGATVFVKTNEWHEITNGSSTMVAVQVTKIGAGAEYK